MKYGVITFHRAINFGAVFQTLALQKALDKSGIENEVIDYRSEFIEQHYAPFKVKDLLKVKKMAIILLKNAGFSKNNRRNFQDFFDKYIKSSEETYHSKDSLGKITQYYDGVITGSDQVWNYLTAGFDKTYFLDFIKDDKKKLSYAASFGVDDIPKKYQEDYKRLLKGFNKVSVREEQGQKILKDMLDIDVPVVLDPTLLLTPKEWTNYMTPHDNKKDYILIYLMAETQSIFDFAHKLSKKDNLDIIYINDKFYRKPGMKNFSRISPSMWLALFYNAKYVITNSFHGLAFSINFNKNFFVEFLPEPAKVNSRLRNTLEKFNLNSRLIDKIDPDMNEKIDYSQINLILEDERIKSYNYIESLKSLN